MARKDSITANGLRRLKENSEAFKQLQANARLGRMVRKLPVGWSLHNYSGNTWSVIDNTGKANVGAAPIDALLAAGITDD